MNKTELVALVADKAEVTQAMAEKVVNSFVDVVTETLSKDEKVVVTGFGTFEVRNRVARRGKNPRTGEEIIVPAQKTPAFKAGKLLKDAVK
ncbi:HU family DNA-binding protein [Acholeplasma laidlawii]|jgi:DNA-binding protein HU-beta|uniref:DNA binding protein, histone-like protein n=3 Tax=Acholeplasma laidlawii TaxID=2148 RepID=A9NGK5_ACHLI|nr:HU family DNA-binding protein [Acholeplasma laidlawii]ABX81485.1 DNA binding protein, histone-like protein [Acholeplasma laidlawii PG-8A]NWH09941.1 HU family DNA-binding protein [Acholeplasma laidlawii]NWH11331.1 HU family DNA-binding protein [Acholeplasma laidlawii]NWH13259.1 HU family DNA-binding protein [Acholeplasma laidlawii]OAN20275.1 DNA-binding protein [Acholeplasma laidlawii]